MFRFGEDGALGSIPESAEAAFRPTRLSDLATIDRFFVHAASLILRGRGIFWSRHAVKNCVDYFGV
jgi:hypothetical protein